MAGTWDRKKITQSIAKAWKTIVENEPRHVIIHPVVPKEGTAEQRRHFGSSVLMLQGGKMAIIGL